MTILLFINPEYSMVKLHLFHYVSRHYNIFFNTDTFCFIFECIEFVYARGDGGRVCMSHLRERNQARNFNEYFSLSGGQLWQCSIDITYWQCLQSNSKWNFGSTLR